MHKYASKSYKYHDVMFEIRWTVHLHPESFVCGSFWGVLAWKFTEVPYLNLCCLGILPLHSLSLVSTSALSESPSHWHDPWPTNLSVARFWLLPISCMSAECCNLLLIWTPLLIFFNTCKLHREIQKKWTSRNGGNIIRNGHTRLVAWDADPGWDQQTAEGQTSERRDQANGNPWHWRFNYKVEGQWM